MKIALTAGFDRSLPALLMAHRLRAAGHSVVAVMVVSPFRLKRLRSMLRSRGPSGVKRAIGKLLRGTESHPDGSPNAVEQLAAESGLTHKSIKAWCTEHSIAHHSLRSLNEPGAAEALRTSGAQVLVYGGGGILRAPLIEAVNGKVLNPHAGPLPEVRGMNAIEWASLLGERQNATIHFIDTGIDTGELIGEAPLPVAAGDDIETLRSKAVATGVRALTELLDGIEHPGQLVCKPNPAASGDTGRQCYTMSPAMRELLAERLLSASRST